MHRVWMLLAVVLSGVAVAACGSDASSSSEGAASAEGKAIKVGFVPKLLGVSLFDEANRCMKAEGQKLDETVTYTAPTDADAQGQVDIFNSLIARKYDVIITSANDPATLAPTLERAMKAGISVISWDSDVLPRARDLFVANADDQEIAEAQVDALVRGLGQGEQPKADIAILSSTPTATAQLTWIKLMKAYLKENYPGLRIVTTQYGESDLGKSLTAAQNLLKAYPSVKGILAPDALAVPGAAQAIEKRGLEGKVVVSGLTSPALIREYIESGTVKEVFLWDYCRAGKLLAQLARIAADGQLPKQFPATISTELGELQADENKLVPSGPVLKITEENVDDYDW